jgi:hypothetical protein
MNHHYEEVNALIRLARQIYLDVQKKMYEHRDVEVYIYYQQLTQAIQRLDREVLISLKESIDQQTQVCAASVHRVNDVLLTHLRWMTNELPGCNKKYCRQVLTYCFEQTQALMMQAHRTILSF